MNKNNAHTHACFLKIHGRVQGVGFRYFCVQQAKHLGIKGWVRNNADTTVELVCEGTPPAVDEFISRCKKGCTFSHVTHVDIEPRDPKGYSSFEVTF